MQKDSLLTLLSLWSIMILQLVVRVKAIKDNYTLYTIILTALLLMIIIFAVAFKGKNTKIHLKTLNLPLLFSWIIMCLFMLYSDIVVMKNYGFLSLILLILFTGLSLLASCFPEAKRDRFWELLIIAVEGAYIFATIFCFLFRPYTNGIRYSGLSANPNVYGMFLITVWICIIAKIDILINKKVSVVKLIIPAAELGSALFFLYMTGARTAFMAICSVSFLWFIFRVFFSRRDKEPLIKYALVSIISFIPAFALSYVLLSTLPGIINHPVSFERDKLFTAVTYDNMSKICYAADAVPEAVPEEQPSLINRILGVLNGEASLDDILNGRVSVFKSYLKKANMKGHKKYNKRIDGVNVVHAHNNYVQMAYTYGIPAAIAYFVLTILTIIYSFKFYITNRKKRNTAILPMLIVAGFLVTSLTECVLLPIQSLLAFVYFLTVGELINSK